VSEEIAEEVARWGMEPPAPFEITDLSTDEQTLWREFPEDYRESIVAVNGGWLTESLWFDVPIVWENEGHRREGKQAELEELWTWQTLGADEPEDVSSVLHEHFGRHVAEQFLPAGIFVIGRATQNSLVAISTRPEDHGAVFYWEWYWSYPWYKPFFESRIRTALAVYDDAHQALNDPNHAAHDEVVDAANYATLLKVASSWTEFVRRLQPESD
jgi:hypothetical protein